MDFSKIADELNAVVPGVTEAYARLRATNGMGIYTSMGAFYNHTLFGRDASMSAKFVTDFDHAAPYETIKALASLQGTYLHRRTQEQPGRIHHEFRDFRLWKPQRWTDHVGFALARLAWGSKNGQMLTYFSVDTTANYIRLVNKYARSIDRSILDRTVTNRRNKTVTIRDSLAAAGNWIADNVDEKGLFAPARTARMSIPYQTFQDSISAYYWPNGRAINSNLPIAYVEAQSFAIDALQDLARLLPERAETEQWRDLADRMRAALFDRFWNEEERFFASAVTVRDDAVRATTIKNITAGWTLNNSFWFNGSALEREQYVTAIARELFSEDFLTPVGIRTRSRNQCEPLGSVIDYHGSQTVWPMFNFMVAEGLRRHGLPRLAEQIERRIINGCNAVGDFVEFFVVDHANIIYRQSDESGGGALSVQFIPEQQLAYTIVPMMSMAYRSLYPSHVSAQASWQEALERELLSTIPNVEKCDPGEARSALVPRPVIMERRGATMRSLRYMIREHWRIR